jgi:uncharacterized membrane protein
MPNLSTAALMSRNRCKTAQFFLSAITLLGFFLRLYNLGQNSLWYDEVCHATAAVMPTVGQAIAVIRTHLMAMPLDYLVVWVFARFSHSEYILRLPVAIWGGLTIPMSYLLFRKFVQPRPALMAVFLLTISPLHVEYSQELRYYASMVFFYTLCSNLLILALEKSTWQRWMIFTAVTVVGLYFHYFVFFCLITGAFWLLIQGQPIWKNRQSWVSFILTSTILTAALIPAFLFFGKQIAPAQVKLAPVLSYPYSILVGLGWIPNVSITPGISWVWSGLTAVFCLTGLIFSLGKTRRILLVPAFSFLLQAAMIFVLSIIMYFPSPRQYIALLPFVYLFCAVGIFRLIDEPFLILEKENRVNPQIILKNWAVLIIFGIWIISAIPAMMDYYHWDKSRALLISQTIAFEWKVGDRVLVMPDADPDINASVYRYYFDSVLNRPDIARSISPTNWLELNRHSNCGCKTYLVTKQLGLIPQLTDNQTRVLSENGYTSIRLSEDDLLQSQRLWVQSENK